MDLSRLTCAYRPYQGGEAARAALAELLALPNLTGLGVSDTTADLLGVLTLLESINRQVTHLHLGLLLEKSRCSA